MSPRNPRSARSARSARSRLAVAATRAVGATSRHLGIGGGSVVGGRVGLAIEPKLLVELTEGRHVSLVSGTNGKTTTTRLLAASLQTRGPVATSSAGSNLPGGLVSALSEAPLDAPAVLEVDEGHLPAVAASVGPGVMVLLNLSRDQLDRVSETRMLAERWRKMLSALEETVAVANCDDPLVTWAAGGAAKVVWVAAGQLWHADSTGCPWCGERVAFEVGWRCTGCGEKRPTPDASLDGRFLETTDGRRLEIRLELPGRCNFANAAMAATAAGLLGVDESLALDAMAHVTDVEGRYATVSFDGYAARMLLAKNPAGWAELMDLLDGGRSAVVVGINARVADGHDPSWLWDVEFERLRGRFVVATGERAADLGVRLRYAGVEHATVPDQFHALSVAAAKPMDPSDGRLEYAEDSDGRPGYAGNSDRRLEYVGNYTAFQELRRRLDRGERPRVSSTSERSRTRARSATGSSKQNRSRSSGASALRVVIVHPDLLGTYGDGGNGRVLAERAAWRGYDVELVLATADRALPESGDIYCLGGGEDAPQVQAAQLLSTGTLARAVDRGANVFAVCAGYQVIGTSFPDAEGREHGGVGLVDVTTVKSGRPRAVGELLAEPISLELGILAGFENHSAITSLGRGVKPLARVTKGIGNGWGDGTEGALTDRIICTYMHGPALARNPALADQLLRMATGIDQTPLDDEEEQLLREERLRASAGSGGADGAWMKARMKRVRELRRHTARAIKQRQA